MSSPANAQRPGALLALWNEVDPARNAEYERWHTLEHVPERVWVPGFQCGSRYLRVAGPMPRYFTLYEMDSLACLDSAEYRTLVEQPTPWSASMRPSLRAFVRKTCVVATDVGRGRGAGIVVVRVVLQAGELAPSTSRHLAESLLRRGAESCVVRIRIGRVSASGPQALANVDSAPGGTEYILVAETAQPAALEQLAQLSLAEIQEAVSGDAWLQHGQYAFCSTVSHSEVAQPSRPAPCA